MEQLMFVKMQYLAVEQKNKVAWNSAFLFFEESKNI